MVGMCGFDPRTLPRPDWAWKVVVPMRNPIWLCVTCERSVHTDVPPTRCPWCGLVTRFICVGGSKR